MAKKFRADGTADETLSHQDHPFETHPPHHGTTFETGPARHETLGTPDVDAKTPTPPSDSDVPAKRTKKALTKDQEMKANERPGTFVVCGSATHDRVIGPICNDAGRITRAEEKIVVQPGQTFSCEGSEAAMCRQDGEKFKEVVAGPPTLRPTPSNRFGEHETIK